ncbi:MAG: hypothetical protein NW703_14110 [Nitrospiraceae bacterium]
MITYLSSRSIAMAAGRSIAAARPAVALVLVVILIGLSAMLYPASLPHLMHHAQHQTGTHGTALCSWECAAGQMADHGALNLPLVSLAPERAFLFQGRVSPSLLAVEGSSRSPPSVHAA